MGMQPLGAKHAIRRLHLPHPPVSLPAGLITKEHERAVTAGLSIFMPLQNATQSPYFGLQGGPRQSVPCLFHNLLVSRSSVCCPHQFLCSNSKQDPSLHTCSAPCWTPPTPPPDIPVACSFCPSSSAQRSPLQKSLPRLPQ